MNLVHNMQHNVTNKENERATVFYVLYNEVHFINIIEP